MDTRKCNKCNDIKLLTEFNKCHRDGYQNRCRDCQKKYRDEHAMALRQYREEHRGETREYMCQYYQHNRDKILKVTAEYRFTHKDQIDQYYQRNRDKIQKQRNKRIQVRLKKDINFSIAHRLRGRYHIAIKNGYKTGHTIDLLGCSIFECREYLESKFQSGMSWDNWGKGSGTWQLDHITPLSSFDLTDLEQQKRAFHYTNLQPLWYEEHLKKTAKDRSTYNSGL